MEKTKLYAIILAGGRGSRMGSDIPKQYLSLKGKPVLAYCFEAFEESSVNKIFAVCEPEYEDFIRKEIIEKSGITKFAGFANNGAERVFSVKNGVEAALEDCVDAQSIYLMIHDGARPLLSKELIDRLERAVKENGAVIPGLPLKETIKEAEGLRVISTPDRGRFFSVQTPQCFRADILLKAYKGFEKEQPSFVPTDDASLVETFTEEKVRIIIGDEKNIKLTTPLDMKIAELYLSL